MRVKMVPRFKKVVSRRESDHCRKTSVQYPADLTLTFIPTELPW